MGLYIYVYCHSPIISSASLAFFPFFNVYIGALYFICRVLPVFWYAFSYCFAQWIILRTKKVQKILLLWIFKLFLMLQDELILRFLTNVHDFSYWTIAEISCIFCTFFDPKWLAVHCRPSCVYYLCISSFYLNQMEISALPG